MAPGLIQIFVYGIRRDITTINIHKDATVKEFFTMISQKKGIPVDQMRAIYTTKQLEIGKRLSDYGVQNESNVFLVLRLLGGSERSIPPEKELDDAVELSNDPDMITWDKDPENKRAKMPCGHAITPESLTAYCRSILDAGRSQFLCPYISQDQPPVYCRKEWDYIDVRRLAVLSEEEIEEFEKKISRNYLIKGMGIQECPKCNSMVQRRNEDCSCEDRRLKMLRNCPRKTIIGVVGCPSLRACVSCGMMIEHVEACKHMRCRCGKEFCFICLKLKELSGWKCGRYNEACTVAAVQTTIPGDN